MSGAGGRFLRNLVGDSRAQRALDETLLDVRTELAEAHHPMARLRWTIRSAIAVGRVSLRVLPFELKAVASDGWMLRLVLWTMLLVPAIMLQPLLQIIRYEALSGWTRLVLGLTLLPAALAVAVPVSSFLAALWSRRPAVSALLPAVGAAAMTLVTIQIMPASNQAFRTIVFAALGGTTAQGPPARGLRELTLGELARTAVAAPSWSSPTPAAARKLMLARTGLVAVAGTFTLLGALLARRARLDPTRRRRRWPYAVGLPALTLVVVGPFATVGFWLVSFTALALAVYVGAGQAPVALDPDPQLQH